MSLHRRDVLKGALLAAAGGTIASAQEAANSPRQEVTPRPYLVIDTNIHLFQWPFRRLPLDTPAELVEKLRALRIAQAWAGSFEGILHRDVRGVNSRLADLCHDEGNGLLIPFGTVNPTLPDWEEDVRRCHEEHQMPGVRLHPNYHGYRLDDPRFARLLTLASERSLLVQLAASMEDTRTQHPMLQVSDVDLAPLAEVMARVPDATVMLLNHKASGKLLEQLRQMPRVYFDIARVDGTHGIRQLLRVVPPNRVVFGTHAPFFIYESALIKVYEAELNDEEQSGLFERNVASLPLGRRTL